jgi:hypothetical protein
MKNAQEALKACWMSINVSFCREKQVFSKLYFFFSAKANSVAFAGEKQLNLLAFFPQKANMHVIQN